MFVVLGFNPMLLLTYALLPCLLQWTGKEEGDHKLINWQFQTRNIKKFDYLHTMLSQMWILFTLVKQDYACCSRYKCTWYYLPFWYVIDNAYIYNRGCTALASIPTTHLLQDHVPGVAVLIWLGALLSARALPPSLFWCRRRTLRLSVHGNFGYPICPLCCNADPFFFCGWSSNMEWTSNRSKAPPKWCLFSIPPPSRDSSFSLSLGWERCWVGILKGRYINFDWLIDIGSENHSHN